MNTNVDAVRRLAHTSTLDLAKDIKGKYAASVASPCVMIAQRVQHGAKDGEPVVCHAVISWMGALMTEYKCGCGAEVGACGIMGTTETYPEEACGHCGVPICTDCYDDSGWMCDGDQCCAPCCAEMKAGADEQKGEAS